MSHFPGFEESADGEARQVLSPCGGSWGENFSEAFLEGHHPWGHIIICRLDWGSFACFFLQSSFEVISEAFVGALELYLPCFWGIWHLKEGKSGWQCAVGRFLRCVSFRWVWAGPRETRRSSVLVAIFWVFWNMVFMPERVPSSDGFWLSWTLQDQEGGYHGEWKDAFKARSEKVFSINHGVPNGILWGLPRVSDHICFQHFII